MGYKVGVLTLHGMGTQKAGYSASWKTNISRGLAPSVSPQVVFGEVYYQHSSCSVLSLFYPYAQIVAYGRCRSETIILVKIG